MKISKVIKPLLLVLLVYALTIPALYAQVSDLNQTPCLYQGVIKPQSGVSGNIFNAQVHYYDPDGKRPNTIHVYINDINYSLKRESGKSNNGIYQCQLTLPPGKHSYYFYAEDDFGKSVRYPRYGALKGPTVGLIIPVIKPAKLTEAGLLTNSGNDKTYYTYTIHYYDQNDKKPTKINVIVDGISHPMKLHKGKEYDGNYIAILNLPPGPHAYYFKAIDAMKNCITLPEKGFIRGPEVTRSYNDIPKLFDVKLEPPIGYKSNTYTYYVTYQDNDYDKPSIMQINIDGETYPLKLKSGKPYNGVYYFRSKHYLGNYHNYYFYCEDGRGGVLRIPETGTYHGPVVVK